MAVALVALFISLGGVSYGVATGSIDSRELKNNAVRSKDVRNNDVRSRDIRNGTLLGADIRDNSLGSVDVSEERLDAGLIGKVPAAGRADTAASADSASSVNGASIRKIDFRPSLDAPDTEILNLNGLTLRANCNAGGPPGFFSTLSVTASTAGGDADLVSETRVPSNTDQADEEVANGVVLSRGFGTGAGDANNVQLITFGVPDGNNGTTHFRASDGRVVVVHWSASDFNRPCSFYGYAVGI